MDSTEYKDDNTFTFESETVQKRKRSSKTTEAQMDKILAFMQSHPDFTKGRSIENEMLTKDWDRLTEDLNNMGPPIHTSNEWRKVWSDSKGNKKRNPKNESDEPTEINQPDKGQSGTMIGNSNTLLSSDTDKEPTTSYALDIKEKNQNINFQISNKLDIVANKLDIVANTLDIVANKSDVAANKFDVVANKFDMVLTTLDKVVNSLAKVVTQRRNNKEN